MFANDTRKWYNNGGRGASVQYRLYSALVDTTKFVLCKCVYVKTAHAVRT